jgi:hypothetical protein
MKNVHLFLIFLFVILINFTNCKTASYTNNANKQFRNDSLIIDPQMQEFIDFVVRQPEDALDEVFVNEMRHSANLKKSSTVEVIEINDKSNFIKTINRLACHAVIKNDTLIIRNGVSGTDAGYGVETKIINNKIFTNYYTYFDLHHEIAKTKIQKQTITLNKSKYSRGDSLFGSINTRMIDRNKMKYYITGWFRTKVG